MEEFYDYKISPNPSFPKRGIREELCKKVERVVIAKGRIWRRSFAKYGDKGKGFLFVPPLEMLSHIPPL